MTESRRSTTGEQGTERGSYGYLYLLQPDGLGTKFVYISLLLAYARKAGGPLIVDFSNLALFASACAVCGEREVADVVSFTTDTIIYQRAEIDRIVREEGDAVLGIAFYEANSSLTKRQPFPSVWAGELFPVLPGRNAPAPRTTYRCRRRRTTSSLPTSPAALPWRRRAVT